MSHHKAKAATHAPVDLKDTVIAVLGCGNLGRCIAKGLVHSKTVPANHLILSRRDVSHLADLAKDGFQVTTDNLEAVQKATVLLVCVLPQALNELLEEIRPKLTNKHTLISCVSGADIDDMRAVLRPGLAKGVSAQIVRAMPNTAIAFGESMTCVAGELGSASVALTKQIFDNLGLCLIVNEHEIVPATALCACGIAFFARAIRAAAQGGVEIGFHAEDAIRLARRPPRAPRRLCSTAVAIPSRRWIASPRRWGAP
jgi:pyrroline-5-carboxylate reductase